MAVVVDELLAEADLACGRRRFEPHTELLQRGLEASGISRGRDQRSAKAVRRRGFRQSFDERCVSTAHVIEVQRHHLSQAGGPDSPHNYDKSLNWSNNTAEQATE